MAQNKKNIVVIGGSYVGAKATEAIANKMHATHNTIMVEKNTHFQHLFAFPRFAVVPGYEHKAFIPYTTMFSQACPPDSTTVVTGKVSTILRDRVLVEKVKGEKEEIPYDFLVLATGTKLTPPGTLHTEGKVDGVKYFQDHQASIKKAEKIVIIGGGAVGIQMATDTKEHYPSKSVTLIHSRPHLMNRYHPKFHELLMERLNELGIEVITNDRVKIPAEGFPVDGSSFDVELTSGRKVPSEFVVIATGQTPNSSILSTLSPQSIRPDGFISVKRTLQIEDPAYPHIFALGDVAHTTHHKAARPAQRQVEAVANNIEKLSKEGDGAQLEEYPDVGMGIHMSLGMARNIVFRNPEKEGEEPTWVLKDDGKEDMNIDRVWSNRAPGLTDYHL